MPINFDTLLSDRNGIGPQFLTRLKKLNNIKTVRDLLYHFPARYEDWSKIVKIADLKEGEGQTIQAMVKEIDARRAWQKRMIIVEATLADDSGEIKAVWFNQPYIGNILKPGTLANFAGKLNYRAKEISLSNPTYELVGNGDIDRETKHTGRLVPIYPETKGLTSKGIRYLVKPILDEIGELQDFIPQSILEKNNLPELNEALRAIHFPKNIAEAERARNRFAFEEIFLLQMRNVLQKLALKREHAPTIDINQENRDQIIESLPFELTETQKKSLFEILADLAKDEPMNRLLQGDVGSGKTVVVGIAAMITAGGVHLSHDREKGDIEPARQVAIMAPTEILARQHYKTFVKLFGSFSGGIALLLSKESRVHYGTELENKITKPELIKNIERGSIKIIIGTHALIQKGVKFSNLALIVVDEQHRFGVQQRAALVRRSTQIEPQINADSEDGFLYKDLTYQIRGAIFKVANEIGLGLKESVYQNALIEEFNNIGLKFEKEKMINVEYSGKKVGVYRPDFVIEDRIILELKSLPFIGSIETKQVWQYLKGSPYKLALLVNFGGKQLDIRRVVYDTKKDLRISAPKNLRESALLPHFLSMSATPIPRTLMFTIFGDLDLSHISELPKGRKPIITKVVDPQNRAKAYAFVRGQVRKGDQVFIICPRIEPPSEEIKNNFKEMLALDMKNVTEEYDKLAKKVFPDLRLSMLHGKMKADEKEKVMREFAEHKTDVLVTTSVIEVGVDVPNATIMIIEGAERFGLAQLYQFRGRVGRGEKQSFCLLFSESKSEKAASRLKALITARNGFELAEYDLKFRGPGEFLGETQTGLPDFALRALQNPTLITNTRAAAGEILGNDPDLENHPLLSKKLQEFQKEIHLE